MEKGAKSKFEKVAQTQYLIYASYHEAGHTIYGLLHFMKIKKASVFLDKNGSAGGFTDFTYLDVNDFTRDDVRIYLINSEICINYAGLTSERYHFKQICGSDVCPLFLKDGSSDDTLDSAKLFRQYNIVSPGKKRYFYKKKLIEKTMNELEIYWSDVILISHSLFKKRKLNYYNLKKILTTKSKNKSFWKEQFKIIELIYKNDDEVDENYLVNILSDRELL